LAAIRRARLICIANSSTMPLLYEQQNPIRSPAPSPELFSGGGGAVSTAPDYLLFCQMLLHDGELGKTRLLSPSTIHLMTSNALKPGIEYASPESSM
jgi:CubicO group peptidase (beta-lactamase class C family)